MAVKWWHRLKIYQVYPKSFKDSNQDGAGDIEGIINKIDYFEKLGINMIWLNPIYMSPQIDNGYDVADYYRIDPSFGTMADVERLLSEAHAHGIKVIFDFVVNHTSDQHPWFQEAITDLNSPYRDFYVFKAGKENGTLPPNNWQSFFGGSTWEKEPNGDLYYFHLFDKHMPDLNWANPDVRYEMTKIAKFWLAKGLDGFRVDAFIHIDKTAGYPDLDHLAPGEIGIAEEHYSNKPRVNQYMKEWREAIREDYPDTFVIGEASSAHPGLANWYCDPDYGGCDAVITFRYFFERGEMKDHRLDWGFQEGEWDIEGFKHAMVEWQSAMAENGGPVLYLSNHDMARALTRFGTTNTANRSQCAKMLGAAMYLQKGIPLIYYGEEIGMQNLQFDSISDFPAADVHSFVAKSHELGYADWKIISNLNQTHKLAARGLMQWTDEAPNVGFTSANQSTWIRANAENGFNVADQLKEEESIFYFYQKLLDLKKENLFLYGYWELVASETETYVYERRWDNERAFVLCNLSGQNKNVYVEVSPSWKVVIENDNNTVENGKVSLAPYGVIVLKNR